MTGGPKFSNGLLRDCKQCLGESSPCLIFSFSCDEEVIDGMSTLLSDGIYWVAVFPLILYSSR